MLLKKRTSNVWIKGTSPKVPKIESFLENSTALLDLPFFLEF